MPSGTSSACRCAFISQPAPDGGVSPDEVFDAQARRHRGRVLGVVAAATEPRRRAAAPRSIRRSSRATTPHRRGLPGREGRVRMDRPRRARRRPPPTPPARRHLGPVRCQPCALPRAFPLDGVAGPSLGGPVRRFRDRGRCPSSVGSPLAASAPAGGTLLAPSGTASACWTSGSRQEEVLGLEPRRSRWTYEDE